MKRYFFLFSFVFGIYTNNDYKLQIGKYIIDASILPKRQPKKPSWLKKEKPFILPKGIDHRKLHMIWIEDFTTPSNRKLSVGMIFNAIMTPIKAVFNTILGVLPPAITMIIKSPLLMGTIMFYFVWYCIERIFFFKSLAALINAEQRLKNYEKIIAKPALKVEEEINAEL